MADKSREIRLGLVLYGGVSLAIYINGVTREFHRAVRGEGIYRVIKALTDSDIAVDILSGTSAGGINGILLAHALVNGGDFKSTAALWREYGDIASLIREPRGSADANSLLDGDGYFRPRLRDAFHKLGETAAVQGRYDDPSPVSELDLFVTSTDVHGDVYTWFDDQGHAVDVKDHHAVFRLKHRATLAGGGRAIRYTDFAPNPDTDLALAKLGRMTSCFPAAFPPVKVAKKRPADKAEAQAEADKAEARADAKLRTWGQLAPDRDYFFLDGGVLDNKPFSYTTRQIFFRLADRDVRRWLFYVEPDPESFTPPARRHLAPPSLVSAALAALVTIPGYESIGGDLKAIAERNADIERFNSLWDGIKQAIPDRTSSAVVAGLRAREEHDAGRSPVPLAAGGVQDGIYVRTRLFALAQRAILGVLRRRGRDQVILEPSERRARAKLVRDFFDHEEAEPLDTLHDFDIYFRLRRILHLLYLEELTGVQARMPPSNGAGDPAVDPVRAMCRALASQVDLLQVVLAYMERTVDGAELRKAQGGGAREAADVWNLVEAALACLLHPVLSERLAGERQVPGVPPELPPCPDAAFLS
ncbi:MAG: patatin-like phospholipase family protein, partial [Chromatiaceae bacterium]|nr:patatin-like phospholipase family protein [Candidatus Thioaporhodococcus sediminis]